jgi:hypothetical protein
MPIRDRNLLGGCRNAIPKGLHKTDTFFYREIVESWRRRRDWFGHIDTYGRLSIAHRR